MQWVGRAFLQKEDQGFMLQDQDRSQELVILWKLFPDLLGCPHIHSFPFPWSSLNCKVPDMCQLSISNSSVICWLQTRIYHWETLVENWRIDDRIQDIAVTVSALEGFLAKAVASLWFQLPLGKSTVCLFHCPQGSSDSLHSASL